MNQNTSPQKRGHFKYKVGVVGGGGHVGLPLAMSFAAAGLKTIIYDIDSEVVKTINQGKMPFFEEDADDLLPKLFYEKHTLEAYDSPDLMAECEFVLMVIGTPVDEHLNPKYNEIIRAIDRMVDYLRDGQVFILRSTVFPGISDHIQHLFQKRGWQIDVSYCPERVAQGYSLREIKELPQIISAFNPSALERVRTLFQKICPEIIVLNPIEAELTKLMTNAWRYIQFATVNQFYTLATENGVDFDKILHACRHNYPRMANLPGPGFTAGPCLVKDTMQLAAYSQNSFILGHSAMLVNEGLPLFIVSQAEKEIDLIKSTAGILGMAFKAESDDHRDSLSYKLKKLLRLKCKQVLCSDPYVKDDRLTSMRELIEKSDIIFIGAPHKIYRNIEIPEGKILFDIWKCVNKNQ